MAAAYICAIIIFICMILLVVWAYYSDIDDNSIFCKICFYWYNNSKKNKKLTITDADKQKFIEYILTKDGCPINEIKDYDFNFIVQEFFEGKNQAAIEELIAWRKA
jgi:hypothetical protein